MSDASTTDFMVFEDAEELSRAAAGFFYELVRQSVDERGRFTVALSGGSTPRRMFEILAEPAMSRDIPWHRVVVFWGDDRAVPPDHVHSNYRMAHDALLRHVSIAAENVHRIQGELGADEAAAVMLKELDTVFIKEDMPTFDLVLQGMGTDGHTASLFPGTNALEARDWVVPVHDPPADPKLDRVTMTFPILNNARTALFLAAGANKQSIIAEIMNDPNAGERYPAARVQAEATLWYVDQAAFGVNG